jgi:hypothetical protein
LEPEVIRAVLLLLAVAALWTSLGAERVQAHNLNNGYSYVRLSGEKTVDYEVQLPFPVMSVFDSNADNVISEEELQRQHDPITEYAQNRLTLYNNEQRMEPQLLSLRTIVQEQTEDRMVQIRLRYTSDMQLGSVTIRYELIFDRDEAHQNYIQLYNVQDELLEHWVVQKGASTVRYAPDSRFRFDAKLMGKYVLSGVQGMLFQPFCWLLLLYLAWTVKRQKQMAAALAYASLYSMIGWLAADRLKLEWLFPLLLALFVCLLLYSLLRKRLISPSVCAAFFGLAWGAGSLRRVADLQLNSQFQLVSLLLYYSGVLLAWLGLMYVIHVVVTTMRKG